MRNQTREDKVAEFHKVFCPDQIDSEWSAEVLNFRSALLDEEVDELIIEMNNYSSSLYQGDSEDTLQKHRKKFVERVG